MPPRAYSCRNLGCGCFHPKGAGLGAVQPGEVHVLLSTSIMHGAGCLISATSDLCHGGIAGAVGHRDRDSKGKEGGKMSYGGTILAKISGAQ